MSETVEALVIDNGSLACKAGFAMDKAPMALVPSVVGHPRKEHLSDPHRKYSSANYIGADAQAKDFLDLKYPVQRGVVTDWDDMQALWEYTFGYQLRVLPQHHPLLLTEAPLNPRIKRGAMAQIMFETFKVPALYVASQGVLPLYAYGKTTGVVFGSGDGVSHVVPVYEGQGFPHAIKQWDLAGRDLTDYLMKLLVERDRHKFFTTMDEDLVRDIKEKLCRVAVESPLSRPEKFLEYVLPDGCIIEVGDEALQCPEAFFEPSLVNVKAKGVDELINGCIKDCDIDVRRALYANIVLSGGNCFAFIYLRHYNIHLWLLYTFLLLRSN